MDFATRRVRLQPPWHRRRGRSAIAAAVAAATALLGNVVCWLDPAQAATLLSQGSR